MRRPLVVLLVLGVIAPTVGAQGAIAVQGFGYPPGQLGAGTLGLGGANAEMDPSSALNPASLGIASRFAISAHFQPEMRRTTVGGATEESQALRFPSFSVTGGRGRFTGGLSFTTFLDRSWANSYADTQMVGGVPIPSTLRASSDGAINDTRFGVAYAATERLQLGLGVHALSGENRIRFGRAFPDSTGVGEVTQASTMSYSGRAISAGVLYHPSKILLVGASARFSGTLDVEQSDVLLAKADMPLRLGAGITYLGITNTTIAARVERTQWTDLAPLGTAQASFFDATEFALGAESPGPRMGGALSMLRLGYRNRTLPFGVGGRQVHESAFTGGVGLPFSRGRSQLDLAVQRASRSGGGATEKAWLISIGLGIRP